MISIAAIIPVRNRINFTRGILEKLTTQIEKTAFTNALKLEIIVVDDGSTDGTPELIKAQFPTVHLIESDGSLWWTGAIAKGMEYALKEFPIDYILWLNDDIDLPDNFIESLSNTGQAKLDRKEVTGGIIFAKDYPNWIAFGGVKRGRPIRDLTGFDAKGEMKVDTLNGNLALIPIKAVHKIGLPNAKRFRHYGGDYEYFARAKVAGYSVTLLRDLNAKTVFTETDIIRYLPPWMQWRLAPTVSAKWKILRGLTSLKTNYNIWHMVNSMNREAKHIFHWQYADFYLRKVTQIMIAQIQPQAKVKKQVEGYLDAQYVPNEIRQRVLNLL